MGPTLSHVRPSPRLHQLGTPFVVNSIHCLLRSYRRWSTMPSIRVKTPRSFYKTLEEETPTSPVPQTGRARSKSVIEVFSGTPSVQSPDPQSQSPRPFLYTHNLGTRLSRVSQQISNTSREALPGPSTQLQYRRSNVPRDDSDIWDEDEIEAVIDHLDVIGAETLHLIRLRRD